MAIARVQAANSGTTTVATGSIPATFGGSVTVGNALICCISNFDATASTTVSSVGDTTANVYTAVTGAFNHGASQMADMWVCKNVTVGGTLTVTANFVAAVGGASLTVIEVSGQDTVTFFDKVKSANGNSTAPNSGAAAATSVANEFVVGFVGNHASSICTAPTFSTALVSVTTETFCANTTTAIKCGNSVFDGILASSGVAETFSATGASVQWVAIVASFLPLQTPITPTRGARVSYELFAMDQPFDDWGRLAREWRYLDTTVRTPPGRHAATPWDTFGFDNPWDDWVTNRRQRRGIDPTAHIAIARERTPYEVYEPDPYETLYAFRHRLFLDAIAHLAIGRERTPLDGFAMDAPWDDWGRIGRTWRFLDAGARIAVARGKTPYSIFDFAQAWDEWAALYAHRRYLDVPLPFIVPTRGERTPYEMFGMDMPWDEWASMFFRHRLPGDLFPFPVPPLPPPPFGPPGKMERVGTTGLHVQPGNQVPRSQVGSLHVQPGNQLTRTPVNPLHKQTQ